MSKRIYCYLMTAILACHCISCSSLLLSKRGCDNFPQSYKVYQDYVKAGYTSITKNEYDNAIDNYNKAIKISPFIPNHYYYRGLAWYKKGDKVKAIKDFSNAITLDPKQRSAYIYRGISRMEMGAYKEASSDYNQALALEPKDPIIQNNLSWLYANAVDKKFQDKGKALEHAKKAVELSNGGNAEILDTLAKAYYINGKVSEAVETEKKAIKLAPKNERLKAHLHEYEKGMMDN